MDADLGPLQIAYKESITQSADETYTLDQTVSNRQQLVTVCLSVHPSTEPAQKHIELVPHNNEELRHLKRHVLKAIDSGMMSGLTRGQSAKK